MRCAYSALQPRRACRAARRIAVRFLRVGKAFSPRCAGGRSQRRTPARSTATAKDSLKVESSLT
jgi:hypothetical protein